MLRQRWAAVNSMTLTMITEWALGQGVPANLEQMADDLRSILVDPDKPAPPRAREVSDLPSPNLGSEPGLEHLHDAICLLLMRYLSPAREGDPALLSSLLDLAAELRIQGAREVVAGLLFGGSYRGIRGPSGPLETQLVETLRRCGLTEPLSEFPLPVVEPDGPGDDAAEDAPTQGSEDSLRGDQIPQVNDPDQVFGLVDAIGEGIADRRSFAGFARVSVRQADFIARAAGSLGLVEILSGGEYRLTEAGAALPAAEDPAGREARHRAVGRHPLLRALALDRVDSLPDLDDIEQLLQERSDLGPGTIRRRAQALRRWVEWWASGGR